MADQPAGARSRLDTMARVLKAAAAWVVVLMGIFGSFLTDWAPPANAGGAASWALGIASGTALVTVLAMVGTWPGRLNVRHRRWVRSGMVALLLLTAALTLGYVSRLGALTYIWPEGGTSSAPAAQRYVRGEVLNPLGHRDLVVDGLSVAAAVSRAGGQPLVDQEALLWTDASRQSAIEELTVWYVSTTTAWCALICALILSGGPGLTRAGAEKADPQTPGSP